MTPAFEENDTLFNVLEQDDALDLRGADLDFFGRNFIALEGRLWAFNQQTGEARGLVVVEASGRPSIVSSEVHLRLRNQRFTLSTILVRDGDRPGELVIRFFAHGRAAQDLPQA
jgi:hypothetical protein